MLGCSTTCLVNRRCPRIGLGLAARTLGVGLRSCCCVSRSAATVDCMHYMVVGLFHGSSGPPSNSMWQRSCQCCTFSVYGIYSISCNDDSLPALAFELATAVEPPNSARVLARFSSALASAKELALWRGACRSEGGCQYMYTGIAQCKQRSQSRLRLHHGVHA